MSNSSQMASSWVHQLRNLDTQILPTAEKKARLQRLKDLLTKEMSIGANLIHEEIRKSYDNATFEIQKSITAIDFVIKHPVENFIGPFLNLPRGYQYLILPRGIVLSITPWNFPVWQLFRVLPWQFWIGNPVVCKPSIYVPKTSKWLNGIVQAALGETFFNTLPAENNWQELETLIADSRVCGVTFTGSIPVGQKVFELCGKYFKYASMELGGSDPFILSPKSPKERLEIFWKARLINEGQSCIASKRLLLPAIRKDELLTYLIEVIQKHPWCGQLAHDSFYENTARLIHQAVQEKCELIWQGNQQGLPAILRCPPQSQTWSQVEFFAPVVLVGYYENIGEAVQMINQSIFGLAASAWDFEATEKFYIARNLQSGMVFFDEVPASHPAVPFGGVNKSGLWYEMGNLGYFPWVQIKICKNLS